MRGRCPLRPRDICKQKMTGSGGGWRRQEGEDAYVADDNFQWTRLVLVDLSSGELMPLSIPQPVTMRSV